MHNATANNSHGDDPTAKLLRTVGVSTAVVAGAIILAPYILPMAGFGSTALAGQAFTAMHGVGLGNGLAGIINGAISSVPLVGNVLATNNLVAAAASGVIGIGGVLLGNKIHCKHDGSSSVDWGKIISNAALITSALIALPSVLTAISVGVVFLTAVFSGVSAASSAVGLMTKTIGSMGSMNAVSLGLGGALASLPHLLSCGATILPTVMSYNMSRSGSRDDSSEKNNSHSSAFLSAAALPQPHHNIAYTDGSVTAEVTVDQPTQAGVPVTARLLLTNSATGTPITPSQLEMRHTEKIHLFVIDQSLKDYQHVHPIQTDVPGVYTFSFTPKSSNQYSVWSDIALTRDGKTHLLKTAIPAQRARNIPPRVTTNTITGAKGMSFQWQSSDALTRGEPGIVTVTVKDMSGAPVTDLEPVMGAFAHLVGFGADGKTIIHSHPLGVDASHDDDRGGPKLRFHVEPQYEGPVQFYLQVRRNGEDVFAPFGQQVKSPLLGAERIARSHHDASHGYAI